MISKSVTGFTDKGGIEVITANGHSGVRIVGSTGNDVLNFTAVTLIGIIEINGGGGNWVGKNQGIAGPHPVPQMQVIFKTDAFQSVVPWLMFNREGLDILVHPLTDDMVDDHTVYALWLGSPIKLKLDTMQRRGYSEALLPKA